MSNDFMPNDIMLNDIMSNGVMSNIKIDARPPPHKLINNGQEASEPSHRSLSSTEKVLSMAVLLEVWI
jgi:hypothetical protein